nr:terminase small subunit [uncultured Tyzzerella sp.]
MNVKQKIFADEYLVCLNATESAIKAGYSKKTAYSIGQRLLKKVEVKNYIDEHLKKLEDEKIAEAKEVMEYLTKVLRGEETEETIVIEGKGDGISKARKIKKEISPKDRLKAAELLGKRYGLFTDKLQVEDTSVELNIKGFEGVIDES